jgi:hypothetical protein
VSSCNTVNAKNPPGGGFFADKTDSLVWREVKFCVRPSEQPELKGYALAAVMIRIT